MNVIYVFILSLAFIYFFRYRKFIDYFTFAYLSCVFYFIPAIFGYTGYLENNNWIYSEIDYRTYIVYIIILISLIISAFLTDVLHGTSRYNRLIAEYKSNRYVQIKTDKTNNLLLLILLMLSFSSVFILYLTNPQAFINPDKSIVSESLGRFHILFYTSAIIGFSLSFRTSNNYSLLMRFLFIFLLVLNLYVGYRSPLVICVLLYLLFSYQNIAHSQKWMVFSKKHVLILVFLVVALLAYKGVAFALKSGDLDLVFYRLLNKDFWLALIITSEPFVTQSILNEVIVTNFRSSIIHISTSIYQLVILNDDAEELVLLFNSFFQPALFPNVDYGMSSNIWAQFFSAGGWMMLIMFVFLFNFIIYIGNSLLCSSNSLVKYGLAPIFMYWVFFLHRTDFNYMVSIQKRIIILFSLLVVVNFFIRKNRRNKL